MDWKKVGEIAKSISAVIGVATALTALGYGIARLAKSCGDKGSGAGTQAATINSSFNPTAIASVAANPAASAVANPTASAIANQSVSIIVVPSPPTSVVQTVVRDKPCPPCSDSCGAAGQNCCKNSTCTGTLQCVDGSCHEKVAKPIPPCEALSVDGSHCTKAAIRLDTSPLGFGELQYAPTNECSAVRQEWRTAGSKAASNPIRTEIFRSMKPGLAKLSYKLDVRSVTNPAHPNVPGNCWCNQTWGGATLQIVGTSSDATLLAFNPAVTNLRIAGFQPPGQDNSCETGPDFNGGATVTVPKDGIVAVSVFVTECDHGSRDATCYFVNDSYITLEGD